MLRKPKKVAKKTCILIENVLFFRKVIEDYIK
jgi:hypothetical protein